MTAMSFLYAGSAFFFSAVTAGTWRTRSRASVSAFPIARRNGCSSGRPKELDSCPKPLSAIVSRVLDLSCASDLDHFR
jgi:hypothetical protein